jgi:protein TonB
MERAALPLRLDWPAAASLLVNALIVLALLGLQIGREAPSAPAPAITVVSLAVPKGNEQGNEDAEAALPAAPALSTPQLANTPSPKPQQVAVRPVTSSVASSPSLVAAPVSAAPALAPAQELSGAGSSLTMSAAPAATEVRKGVADGLDAKAAAGSSRSYAARVRSWLYAHKTYPRRSRMRREEGLVQVHFVLDRQGVLLEGAITRRSGYEALDEEAQAMMQRSSPYPRAPADLAGDRIEFSAPIEFALPS